MDTGEIPDLLLPLLLIQWPLASNLGSIWNRHCCLIRPLADDVKLLSRRRREILPLGRSIKSQSQNNSLITCLKLWTEAKIKNNIIFPIFDVFFLFSNPPTHNNPGTYVLTYIASSTDSPNIPLSDGKLLHHSNEDLIFYFHPGWMDGCAKSYHHSTPQRNHRYSLPELLSICVHIAAGRGLFISNNII